MVKFCSKINKKIETYDYREFLDEVIGILVELASEASFRRIADDFMHLDPVNKVAFALQLLKLQKLLRKADSIFDDANCVFVDQGLCTYNETCIDCFLQGCKAFAVIKAAIYFAKISVNWILKKLQERAGK